MKTTLLLGLALVTLAPAHAQIFRPSAVNGAVIGGLAGAVIGNNSGSLHHNAWRGAAIGATTGLLIGAAIDDSRGRRGWHPHTHYRSRPDVYVYRRDPFSYRTYRHRGNGPGYYYYSARPDYRASSVFFGGATGAIIGHNSRGLHHNAWRGAAWGAGLGYVFGSIAERNARSRAVIETSPAMAIPSPAPAVQPQQVTIINNYYNAPASPMSSANGLFGR